MMRAIDQQWTLQALVLATALLLGPFTHAAAPGARLETDAAVRDGLTAIRRLTLTNHTLITHRRLPLVDAERLSSTLLKTVQRLRRTTSLTGDGRRAIDSILDTVSSGAALISGENGERRPLDGLAELEHALSRYAEQFDHPGWKPLR
jgi:hypothetical protein